MPMIETERLILRDWSPDDVDDMYEYAKHPNVGPKAGWSPHQSREESLYIINNVFLKNPGNGLQTFAMQLKSTGRVIGSIGLDHDDLRHNPHSISLGYAMGEPYWGQGLMPEGAHRAMEYAFEELGTQIISVRHFSNNPQSRRVIEKLGFHIEGILRQCRESDSGIILDDWIYSITKAEFASR